MRAPSIGAAAAAVPDAAIAATFLVTWVRPGHWGYGTVRHLLLVMLLEFVNIHASAFFGSILFLPSTSPRKVLQILGLAAFYTTFVVIFAAVFHTWWPVWTFWGLVLNRLLNVILGNIPDGRERELVTSGWVVACAAYLVSVFATVFLPIPHLGLTADVLPRLELPGSGLWVDEPHRVIAAGVLYFGLQAAWNLYGERSLRS